MKASNLLTVSVLTLGLMMAAPPMRAEEPKAASSQPGDVQTAIFIVQHADVKTLQDLITPLTWSLKGSVQSDVGTRTLVVIGSKELVAACAAAIKKLDVPPKPARNIELTFYILVASQKPIPNGDCPEVIRSFCEQMKGIYRGFRLLETVTIRAREGSREVAKGIIPAAEASGETMPYKLHFDSVQLVNDDRDPRSIIRINKLEFTVSVTTKKEGKAGSSISNQDVGFNANVDFREGQDAAISTLSQGTPGESLCIVARGKVLD